MLKPNKINELDDYSYGRLSSGKRSEIESQLTNDRKFAEEAEAYFELFNGFKGLEIDALQDKMNQWEANSNKANDEQPSGGRIINLGSAMFKYAAAAVVVLAFLPLGYQLLFAPSLTSEDIFAANFETKEAYNLLSSRSGPDTSGQIKTPEELAKEKQLFTYSADGIEAYNNKEYKAAIDNFSAYLALTDNESDDIEFYLAVSYLAEGQTTNAIPIFEKIKTTASVSRKSDAQWYLVLTLLKDNNVNDALQNLDSIIQSKRNNRYKEKAKKLKAEIEKHLLQ